MELDIYIVDAFTQQQFAGNSAAVVPLSQWLAPEVMQNIAAENNLSETAFIKEEGHGKYAIRWFSPLTEIDFCGHATLASSYVIFDQLGYQGTIEFVTQAVGNLFVSQGEDGRIQMSFPNQCPEPIVDVPHALVEGLSIKPQRVLRNRQAYFVVLSSQQEVQNVIYNSEVLKTLAPFDVVVTAKGSEVDFVSRYFWPANGGDEDPVTGSIHSGLAPFWANELGKTHLQAYQASRRGGLLYCQLQNERVLISGSAVLYLQGRIFINGPQT
ncbi:PhzF family phenazine biosynthesis protein [Pseudoalteromonas sp. SSDWG2]|uniref:PhzF family phenazine biosynthesis protein n=1 Tax=Pseudoalteromonas sp. SSDWG2 TaxID=3139391 RepID=UPI003BABF55D